MYKAQRQLNGRWVVIDPDGSIVENSHGTKEEAEALAEKINGK